VLTVPGKHTRKSEQVPTTMNMGRVTKSRIGALPVGVWSEGTIGSGLSSKRAPKDAVFAKRRDDDR
jgi:hypothetical protein